MDKYYDNNLNLWNELTLINKNSRFYDIEGFRKGKSTLKSIELEEIGDVTGKTLLHLQCHFGLDTISWAGKGAHATGADFSPTAIELAKSLKREVKSDADFICCSIYDLKEHLSEKFDIVFTSYGVLPWLCDLKKWGHIISHFLKEGGIFYIVEIHPFSNVFENERYSQDLKVTSPYFHSHEPVEYPPEGSYADRDATSTYPSYEWSHSMSDIINVLLSNGMNIEFFHEFPFCVYDKFPFMYEDRDGWWRLKDNRDIPLMFSIKARKKEI